MKNARSRHQSKKSSTMLYKHNKQQAFKIELPVLKNYKQLNESILPICKSYSRLNENNEETDTVQDELEEILDSEPGEFAETEPKNQ